MGVYIKGVDYANCDKCPLSIATISKTCSLNKNNCPLVEVKIPHGRLIDADVCKQRVYDGSRTPYKTCPTVIEAEVE